MFCRVFFSFLLLCIANGVQPSQVLQPAITHGMNCTTTSNLIQNSNCINGIIMCNRGYKFDNDTCVIDRNAFGVECNNKSFCSSRIPNSVCMFSLRSYTCQCASGFRWIKANNSCVRNGPDLPARICTKKSDCSRYDKNSMCNVLIRNNLRKCGCKSGYKYNVYTKVCTYKVIVDILQPCNDTTQCEKANPRLECFNGLNCRCKVQYWTSYLVSQSKFVCMERALINQICSKDYDCYPKGSSCIYGVCKCKPGEIVFEDATCRKSFKKDLHEECMDSSQCKTRFSKCSHKYRICVCDVGKQAGHYQGKWVCAQRVTVGERCNNYDIFENSACVNGTCVCKSGYLASGNSCIKYEGMPINNILICICCALSLIIAFCIVRILSMRFKSRRPPDISIINESFAPRFN